MKKLILCTLILATAWAYFRDPPARWKGTAAAGDPEQKRFPVPKPFAWKQYTVEPLANYRVTAVVLGAERYRYDAGAEISPIDLALGWGRMSQAKVISALQISQDGRFYEYRWQGEPPIPLEEIVSHSANTHCIPATPEVQKLLFKVKQYQRVTLEGYLVEIRGPNGMQWRSSLTREDSGGGACELLWVTRVSTDHL